MINKLYRQDYDGEFIIHTRIVEEGKTEEAREYVPKTVDNQQTCNKAVIIGNGTSRDVFDLNILKRQHSKVQTYGCNALYRTYTPDFLVSTDSRVVDEIMKTDYTDNNIMYSSAPQLVKYPGKLHLIPYNQSFNAGSLATYMACFDGHKKIFLIGFDGQETVGLNNNVYAGTDNYDPAEFTVHDAKWIKFMKEIFETYDDVQFFRVMPSAFSPIPELWKDALNFKQITYRDFAIEADL